MKSSFYFQHDYNSHNDERVLMLRSEYGAEGYGVFWMIIETMAMSSKSQINRVAIGGLSLGYGVAKDRLSSIIDYCLTIGLLKESQDGAIFSDRLRQSLAWREALKTAGKIGADKRWSGSHKNRVANGKGKERKGNNIHTSVDTDVVFLFEEYKRMSGRTTVLLNKKREGNIKTRLKELPKEKIRQALAQMAVHKFLRGDNERGIDYFTVDYAFRLDRIEHYYNEFIRSNPQNAV